MRVTSLIVAATFFFTLGDRAPTAHAADSALHAANLRCEHEVDPLGVDSPQPRLSWIVQSPQRNQKQTAYQILVAADSAQLQQNTADLWDSGKVDTDQTVDLVYAGKPLAADTYCYWKVRVWDRDGNPSDWSAPALWTVGLADAQWTSQWIGFDASRTPPQIVDAPLDGAQWIWSSGSIAIAGAGHPFITQITVPDEKTIRRAVLCVAASAPVSFNVINYHCVLPAMWKDAQHAITVDVTRDVRRGKNPLTAIVGAGKSGQFIAKLLIEYEDGSQQSTVTDGSWTSAGAPVQVVSDYANTQPRLLTEQLAHTPPSYERGTFTVSKPVQSALLYVTALGLCDVHLNGNRVTDDLFIPGWTDFDKRVYYRAYDVTKQLAQGPNALAGILTDGWYSGYIGWDHHQDHYGKNPRFRAEIHIRYADGSTQVVGTGPDWKSNTGAITTADLQMGENEDARLRSGGWDTAAFDDSHWPAAAVGAEVKPVVSWHPGPPVRAIAELKPASITQPRPGIYVVNLGQYTAGVARLEITGQPGQEIVLRYGERLNADGTLYVANLRLASATDRYVCRGGAEEIWQPRFTFHGFQYVEIRGLTQPPDEQTLTGLAYTSDTPPSGSFDSSDPMLNRLHENVLWTQRANFIDIPTDCPQRDERQGWTGDAQVYCRTATLNTDVQGFFTKWTLDLSDAQRPNGDFPSVAPLKVGNASGGTAWADAGVIVPWTMYYVYGDKRLLERQYPSMARFVDFSATKINADGIPVGRMFGVGDHLAPGGNFSTPIDVIFMAYIARSTLDTAMAADVLGKIDDAKKYHALFDRIKAGFNKKYVDKDGKVGNGTQASYAMAVESHLLDDAHIKLAADLLAADIKAHADHITTGFLGTRDLMLVLSQMGRNDLAYKLIHQTTYPSWGFEIANGATSMWERWDGWTTTKGFEDPAMNSFAHYSFGAVYNWMVENIGGIRTDGPAYSKLIIAPDMDDSTTWAKVTYDSVHGPIQTSWKRDGDTLTLDVQIPANTTATIYVPTSDPASVTEGGQPLAGAPDIKVLPPRDGKAVFSVRSGDYHFIAKYPAIAGGT